jgi:hypothetical protein
MPDPKTVTLNEKAVHYLFHYGSCAIGGAYKWRESDRELCNCGLAAALAQEPTRDE